MWTHQPLPLPHGTLTIPVPTSSCPYPGFTSWRSCSSDFLFVVLKVVSASSGLSTLFLQPHDSSDIPLLPPNLPSPNFLSASNCLGLEMAAHQQILVACIFLLPLQPLFLYYYTFTIFIIHLGWKK